jgi:hypothetical protein
MYPLAREAFGDGDLDWEAQDWRVILARSTYVYSAAHQFLTSVAGAARVATSGADLTGKTNVLGVLDADNVVFPTVSGFAIAKVIIYQHTGVEATSRLGLHLDTLASGVALSITPNGTDIRLRWSDGATKIWRI